LPRYTSGYSTRTFLVGNFRRGFWAGGRGEADDDSRESGFNFSIFSMLCCNAMLAWGDRAPDLEFWSWRPQGDGDAHGRHGWRGRENTAILG
jgi:hypothetical protein